MNSQVGLLHQVLGVRDRSRPAQQKVVQATLEALHELGEAGQ
ncbi:MAG: hypothetical protein ACYTAQ_08775 [Planctomycetota bacterium]